MPHVDHVIPKILDEMQFHVFKIRPENQIFIIFFIFVSQLWKKKSISLTPSKFNQIDF